MRKRRSYLRAYEYASNMRVCIVVYTDEAYCVLEKASSTPFNMVNRQPLANKYSLDISRDRLIPTYKYTYTYTYVYMYTYIERSNASRNAENFWNDAFFQFVIRANERVNSNAV